MLVIICNIVTRTFQHLAEYTHTCRCLGWTSGHTTQGALEEDEEDSDCETEDDNAGQDVVPKIKSYKEAIVALKGVVLFLQHKGNTKEAMSLGSTIDAICTCRNASTVQTTLDSFLSRHWASHDIIIFIVHSELKLRTQIQFRFVSFLVVKMFLIHLFTHLWLLCC